MPTISQFPTVAEVTAADSIPISQAGATHAVSVGALLASMQPAVISESGTLLGRISLGPGGPEAITVGPGLLLNNGTLLASSFDLAALPQPIGFSPDDHMMLESEGTLARLPLISLRGLFTAGANITIDASGTISSTAETGPPVTPFSVAALPAVATIAGSDLIAISHGGTDHAISYSGLLDGLTIDQAQPAAPAADSDTLWVAQGSSTMLSQTFAAIWSWLASKQPSYKVPVVELTTDTTLDGTVHNGRILICSQPIEITPAPLNMGSGFRCDIVNLSGGEVVLGNGITSSSGSNVLPSGKAAVLTVATYSGGTVVFAALPDSSGGVTAPAAPGQVDSLIANTPTANSVALSWSPPGSGGTVSSYTVQYRIAGNTTWSIFNSSVTGTASTVTLLAASTSYEFRVYATNPGGSGPPSAIATASTTAPPGNVTALTWFTTPVGPYVHGAGTIGVNALVTPASAAVQFGFSTSATVPPASWTAAIHINTNVWGTYAPTPASAGSWYAWVRGTDGSMPTVHPTPFTVT